MAVRRRQKISDEKRQLLVRAIDDPEQDYLTVADTLGVNRSTARGIVKRYLEEGRVEKLPRGGRTNLKVDDEMKQCFEAIVNENPILPLEAINRKLRETLPHKPHVHSRTIGKILDGVLYTLKLVRRCPAQRNRPDVIQRRRKYAAWFLEEAIDHQVVFVYECGFNVWTARSQGRARRGDRAYRQVLWTKRK